VVVVRIEVEELALLGLRVRSSAREPLGALDDALELGPRPRFLPVAIRTE